MDKVTNRLAGDARRPEGAMTAPADSPRRVVVVGGGLAGMAATLALEQGGIRVTLVESRRKLGGRAGSFDDPRTGETLDNCQHVLLGCCTNLLNFYTRMGVKSRIEFHRTIIFCDERARLHRLRGVDGLPAPLHLAGSLARFGILSGPERISVIRAMLAMARIGRTGRAALADVPFGEWLDEHRQSPSLVQRFYEPILISALNEHARRASAAYAIQVFQEAMLANRAGYVMGIPACPLGELYTRMPAGEIRMGQRVASLKIADDRVSGIVLNDGEESDADAIVLATDYSAARRLVPEKWLGADVRFASLDRLQNVPILGAHLWFDRPVMPVPHVAPLNGPLHWVFRKNPEGTALHGVISAARELIGQDRDRLARDFESQVRSIFPAARQARLVRSTVVIEKRATFSPEPGIDRFRPPQAPPTGALANLFLAGDYTQTGWPATMEGAVRSGYLAADSVLAQFFPNARHRSFVVPDLPIEIRGVLRP